MTQEGNGGVGGMATGGHRVVARSAGPDGDDDCCPTRPESSSEAMKPWIACMKVHVSQYGSSFWWTWSLCIRETS